MTNTIVNTFNRNLGNGIIMGKALVEAIDHVVAERDTTVIVKLINAANKKGDTQAERAVRTTFASIFIGAKVAKTKEGNISIKIKDATVSNEAMSILHDLAGVVSMRGSNWSNAFKGELAPKEFDAQAWAQRQVKANPDKLEAMIAALQAQRNSLKAAA